MNASQIKMNIVPIRQRINALLSIIPILLFSGCIAVTITWFTQKSHLAGFTSAKQLVARSSERPYVETTLFLTEAVSKVTYEFWITDKYGSKVFSYPDITIDRHTGADPNNIQLAFPSGMPEGKYHVYGTARYRFNPVHTSEIQFEMAIVEIDNG